MPRPPWSTLTGLDPVVSSWLASGYVRPCLAADRRLDAEEGAYAPFPGALSASLRSALESRGIERLYQHQAQAFEAARAGSTSSSPRPRPAARASAAPPRPRHARAQADASAIYLYPTKALSRDQEADLRGLIRDAGLTVPALVYDGDTPGDARRAARERCPIVMTNPDMLHAGILPQHAHWARMFQKLRYVILDELHTYRGVFGSHVAHVIARLRRAARFHGANPTFLCATATIGNPREHAARLLGEDEENIALVDRSGAPRGSRRFFVFNPPVVNAELGIRASTLKSAVNLAADLVRARVPTIVFGHSRNSVEIMLKYLRDKLASDSIDPEAIMAYRGGYLPETRRRIEKGLREGSILCVVATNALELGIDIGDLDAVICAGYPGSVAGAFQRFGRAGRRGEASVAVLVASSEPLDQYLAQNPDFLFDADVESARIDPHNTEILIQHLKCAAFELPFVSGERYAAMPEEDTSAALGYLAGHGVVHEGGGRFHWAADAYPANHVSLRSVGWDNFVIIDVSSGKALGELDFRAAPTMLHEQAIYQHDAEQYQVEKLDYENHKAFVRPVEPDYFTTALTHRKVSVIELLAESRLGRATVAWGEVSVVEKVVGYKKIKFFTHENAGYGDVRLPDIQMHTTSFWLTVPEHLCGGPTGRADAIEGLRGIAVALETVATLALMCDPRDLGQTLGDKSDEEGPIVGGRVPEPGFDPTIFLFDNVPSGVGLAERIYERAADLLAQTRLLLRSCPCPTGCPLCVGATESAHPIRKKAALAMLASILSDA
ncbi:MAG: Zn-binding domain-containing protein [Byssovorax sp.]